ncbi:hypothetical protein C475_06260 [Halosimplex carlsbadense 2-9-1]|uniref:Uncharacterized protein n=1 Tax=Halosimplex carlsbadense 2-9-1 TaxID=797114 RepID=M0CWE4_9EURY|nr:hypothetical protein [Halosimplex carlsbadense]ELZ27500.1 hypothetical protein C475_06260 [Halosimplex carlsbadense 2-9-1]
MTDERATDTGPTAGTDWRTAGPEIRLTDADAAEPPRETTPADAQAGANFVVFEPGWLPDDCAVGETTIRPEQPPGRPEGLDAADIGQTPYSEGNPSAVRTVVAGEDRELRIKQFCYDWAPPAASVAPLWGTEDPAPVEAGDAVGFLGTDYKDNRGACVQRARTQVEVSVLEGAFDDDELEGLLDGLEPAADPQSTPVRQVPFHRLNYWARYRCEAVGVPHGLWSHGIARPYDESVPCSPAALGGVSPALLVPGDDGTGADYALDSAATFPDSGAVEAVYRRASNGSDHLWITAAAPDSELGPAVPPEPADQPAQTRETVELRGERVHYAALTEGSGAWEAVWTEGGVTYAVVAGASHHLDGEAFRRLVEGLEPV